MSIDEENEGQANKERPRASRCLEMPTTPTNKTSSVAMTPPNSGNSQRAEKKNVSPNLKEISEKEDLDTPEKVLLMKQRSSASSRTCMRKKQGKFGDGAFEHVRIWRPRSEGHRQ
ncbi:unnamed protein product [Pocillopora meandrina]|uniref:Uncharacterized protein n=1 Tax=Pocillopora meandrina TaxID=46732 RepID=A0AAU9WZB8_9CNID|nr:unnamed protein product [Pocillopora meandrina]